MSAERALQASAIDASRKPVLIRVTGSVPLGTGRGRRSFTLRRGVQTLLGTPAPRSQMVSGPFHMKRQNWRTPRSIVFAGGLPVG